MRKLLLAFAAVAALVGCDKDDDKVVYKAEINLSDVTVYAGDTKQLEATITPATDVVWEWTSSDEAVATVDGSGMVTAIVPGETTIKASTTVGGGIVFDECKVTVVEKPTIALDKSAATVNLGKTLVLTATIQPADMQVTWSSNNEAVATVENGTVTGVAEGEATITAKISDDIFAECKITVKNAKTYKIGDIVEFGGEKGIVFWLTEDETGGKAVSFKESGAILWATAELNCNANSEEDGERNTEQIKTVGLNYHPAAKWCVDLGDGWYMPAITEGTTWMKIATTLNPIITANGGTAIQCSSYDYYWSSTEGESSPNEEVMVFHGGSGPYYSDGDFKTSPEGDTFVRAVHKF